ncbi:MAG: hypothetical protein HC927_06105 [Deltaproteobacteria bacterium]|nr:hypothetical protein [Deltaproteobacteria bacterium]
MRLHLEIVHALQLLQVRHGHVESERRFEQRPVDSPGNPRRTFQQPHALAQLLGRPLLTQQLDGALADDLVDSSSSTRRTTRGFHQLGSASATRLVRAEPAGVQ